MQDNKKTGDNVAMLPGCYAAPGGESPEWAWVRDTPHGHMQYSLNAAGRLVRLARCVQWLEHHHGIPRLQAVYQVAVNLASSLETRLFRVKKHTYAEPVQIESLRFQPTSEEVAREAELVSAYEPEIVRHWRERSDFDPLELEEVKQSTGSLMNAVHSAYSLSSKASEGSAGLLAAVNSIGKWAAPKASLPATAKPPEVTGWAALKMGMRVNWCEHESLFGDPIEAVGEFGALAIPLGLAVQLWGYGISTDAARLAADAPDPAPAKTPTDDQQERYRKLVDAAKARKDSGEFHEWTADELVVIATEADGAVRGSGVRKRMATDLGMKPQRVGQLVAKGKREMQ